MRSTNKEKIGILTFLLVSSFHGFSQTTQQSAWQSWVSSYKISTHWSLSWDTQLRSADNVKYLRQTIVRPGLTYSFNKDQNITLGYGWIETFNRLDNLPDNDITEHRIWQQFIQSHKISKLFAMHRFRVEQRFIERPGNNQLFSQRFRYFIRGLLPIKKYEDSFTKGPYIALQNEAFIHLQNKDRLNGSFFDQNRAYVALGARLSPKIDLEIGYMNQYLKGESNNTANNIAQLGVTTRF